MLVRLVELSDSEAHFCVYNVLEVITKARVSENGDWVSDPRRSSPCTLTSKWRGSGVSCQGAFRHPAFVLAHIWLPYSVGWVWLRRRQVRLSALLPSQLSPNNSMRSWEPERNVQGCERLLSSFWDNVGMDDGDYDPGYVTEAKPAWISEYFSGESFLPILFQCDPFLDREGTGVLSQKLWQKRTREKEAKGT